MTSFLLPLLAPVAAGLLASPAHAQDAPIVVTGSASCAVEHRYRIGVGDPAAGNIILTRSGMLPASEFEVSLPAADRVWVQAIRVDGGDAPIIELGAITAPTDVGAVDTCPTNPPATAAAAAASATAMPITGRSHTGLLIGAGVSIGAGVLVLRARRPTGNQAEAVGDAMG